MGPVHRWLLFAILVVLLAGCAGRRPPTPAASARRTAASTAAGHVVKRGETLYAISMRHGIDYRHLAKWNNIASPYTIYAGQKLVLRAPSGDATAGRAASPPRKPTAKRPTTRKPTPKKPSSNKNVEQVTNSLRWSWPTDGRVVVKFDSADTTKNGIDIEGEEGQDIRVAEAGQVVYSGSGLVGYGNLVIVKHSEVFLTAYGYNAEVFVKEGDNLKAGTVIAKMGRGLERRPALHFQVRKEGKPVNPLLYLPKRN